LIGLSVFRVLSGQGWAFHRLGAFLALFFFKKEVLSFCFAEDGLLRFARDDEGLMEGL
jgi:hypothetical protein